MRSKVLLVCGLSAMASADPCPPMANFPHALTRANAEIVDGGGIIVGALPERDDGKPDPRGTVAEWRFAKKAVKVANVAPGLDVVAVSTAGTLASKDGDDQITVRHASSGSVQPLPPPEVVKVERTAEHGKHPFVAIVARLSADPPASALVIVAFDKTGKVARSWGTVPSKGRAPRIYTTGGCAPLPAGTADSPVGDEVTLAWLDASGRLSRLSAPVKVTPGS